jgi:drug/metabolite transporter (DMT)-like permease
MNKELTPLKADLMLLLVAFLWGSSYVVTKGSIDLVEPLQVIFFRFSIAALLSLIFFGKDIKSTSRGEIKAGFILGTMLSFGMFFALYGIRYTSVSKNSFIISTNVVIVPFLYWAISKRKPTVMSIAAVCLMALGLGFLTLDFSGDFKINIGDIISFGCIFFYAGHVVLADNYSKKYNPVSVNTIAMITAALSGAVFLLLTGDLRINIPKKIMGDMIYLAVFPTFLCYTMQINAQKYTNATHAAIILSLESVFATLLAVLILKEEITLQMVAGFTFIFISVLTSELGDTILETFREKYAVSKTEIQVNPTEKEG